MKGSGRLGRRERGGLAHRGAPWRQGWITYPPEKQPRGKPVFAFARARGDATPRARGMFYHAFPMKTWHEVMRVAEARALVEPIRKGYNPPNSYTWVNATQTAPVRVMVVDDGCDIGHPNLPTPHEAYSFASNRAQAAGASQPQMLNPKDSSHGTMSAGMVVGKPDEGAGFLGGVAADLLGVEFCPVRYNPNVDFNTDKVMYEKLLTAGAKVITNSFGWVVTTNQRVQFETMIRNASAVFIFAAGNMNKEVTANTIFYNAIYVSASIPGDTLADEVKVPASNYGPGIIVCAPGGAADNQAPISTVNGGRFDAYSDTSAACAIVAGVVTLMLLAKPTLTPSEIKDILAKTAAKIDPSLNSGNGKWNAQARGVLNGNQQAGLSNEALNRPYSKYYGFGRVNAEAAVTLAIAS